MIFTTAYTSEMVRPMSEHELVELLVDSRARNAERGVTGLLLYRSGRVLQMLEGDEAVVRALYDRIRMDVRHQHVTNVWSSSAAERRFPSWTMGFDDLERPARPGPVTASLAGHDESGAFTDSTFARTAITVEQQDYLERRRAALRRALVSGDRLYGALGIILNGHEPEVFEATVATARIQCRECRSHDEPALDSYPCPTAKNALWALEATAPR